MFRNKTILADDDTGSLSSLFRLRFPSLVIGLILGITLSFVTSRFEEVLAKNIALTFFIPLVIYLADAVGTQTQSIYIRDLKSRRADFHKYLVKESLLGVIFGACFGLLIAPVTYIWLHSSVLTLTVSLSIFVTIATAPVIALFVAQALNLDHQDPAVGAGPIATVIQDTLSVLIFGLIAILIIL